jgi:hypothetical protein
MSASTMPVGSFSPLEIISTNTKKYTLGSQLPKVYYVFACIMVLKETLGLEQKKDLISEADLTTVYDCHFKWFPLPLWPKLQP